MSSEERSVVGVRLDPRRNSLNAIRLGLAMLVVVSHSWPIGGYGADPGILGQHMGDWAVAGFFGISGYLITMSRDRSRSIVDFLWRRVLRIYPGYWTVLILTAFVIAPLTVLAFGGEYRPSAGVDYVLSNATLMIRTWVIPGTLVGVPYPQAWNGSLWTLFYEFLCYVGIGVLVSVLPRRTLRWAIVVVFVLLTSASCVFEWVWQPLSLFSLSARFGAFFAAGAILYYWRDRTPLTPTLAVVATVVFALTLATGTFFLFAGLPVAYLMLFLGARLPLHGVGARNDISYGLYVYAFPVQQVLVQLLPHQVLPVGVFAGLSILATIPFAWASWLVVERPAMRLKRLTAGRRVDAEGHVDPAPRVVRS